MHHDLRQGRAGGKTASIAVVLVVAAVVSGPGGARAAEGDLSAVPVERAPNVRARLLADVRAYQAGRAFTVGVLIEMKPGWHVYWKNPGDAGLATEVQWQLPRGFSAGELHWPIPSRFRQAGGIDGYGYDTAVLLWANITPPRRPPAGGEIRIDASVSWLACKDRCVPGQAELDLKLPVGDTPASDNTELFDRWRKRLPAPLGSARAEVTADVRCRLAAGSKWGTVQLELKWLRDAPRGIEWYPGPADALEIGTPSVKTTGKKTLISVRVRVLPGQKLSRKMLESLVVYRRRDGARRAVALPVPLQISAVP